MKTEKRVFEKTVENCMECPAHTCFDQKCRCKVVDRIIPQGVLVEMTFPEFCPLKKVKG